MDIQGQRRQATNRCHNGHAVSKILHEMTVHDVQVQRLHPGLLQTPYLGLQIAKVAKKKRRQNRRSGSPKKSEHIA
jgi:hypothetical protein